MIDSPASLESHAADLDKLKRYFAEASYRTQDARKRSLQCIDYYDSDQYTAPELAKLADRNQPPIVINRIKPAINGIIGVTEKGRSAPRCWPRNPQEEDTADAATDVLRYISDFNRFKRIKQSCFRDMLVLGTMAALVGADHDTQVTITQIRWEEFFADPMSRREDFKDARYIGIAKWMYADDVAGMYPDKASSIQSAADMGASAGVFPDESYQDRPLTGAGTGMTGWVDKKMRRLMVVEMYYQNAGWKRCVFTGSDVLEEGPSPYTDHKGRPDCPIEAMSAFVKRDNSRYGPVWDMIGPQDEINKRRSSALWRLVSKQVEVSDPIAMSTDVELARREAVKPDGVLPPGFKFADNKADVSGHLEMMQESKSEIERMGPSPAILGRDGQDSSGRALLARQQSGLVELASLYGGLEDWELRIYRQCWARAKQFWKAPQFIRVTDDEDAPKFVGLNQPVQGGPPTVGVDPQTGMATLQPGVLGYKNVVGEMDVDIEIDTQQDTGTIAQEAFTEIMQLVSASPVYQQQISLVQLIQLSPIPHKRAILDQIKQAAEAQQQQQAQAQAMAQQAEQAKVGEIQARTQLHGAKAEEAGATGFAKSLNALTEAHIMHNDHAAGALEAGLNSVQQPVQAPAVDPNQAAQMANSNDQQDSAQSHQADMAQQAQQNGPQGAGQ